MSRMLPKFSILCLCLPGAVGAATVWSEATDGDLSSLAAAPTAVPMAIGSNVVEGSVNAVTDVRGD